MSTPDPVPVVNFEWDEAKSERNYIERGLPFNVAIRLFDGLLIEQADSRQDYGETRMQVIGMVAGATLFCVYTDRERTRRIISLRYANRRERDAYRAVQSR